MPRQQRIQKLNPLNVKDKEVANNLDLAAKNFIEIFTRMDGTRIARSPTLAAKTITGPGLGIIPELNAALSVTGSKPVLVGLASEIQRTTTNTVALSTVFQINFAGTAGVDNPTTLQVYSTFKANGIPFCSTLKALSMPFRSGAPLFPNMQVFYSPSEFQGIDYPTNPGVVNYSFEIYQTPTGLSVEQSCYLQSIYLFACELF